MGHIDLGALQDIEIWGNMTVRDCQALGRIVGSMLPATFQFTDVETHRVGQQQYQIAHFVWVDPTQPRRISFALIPGGTVTLGWDRRQRTTPLEPLLREWVEVMEDGEEDREIRPEDYAAFDAYCDAKLRPLRTVTLHPFLIETDAQEAGLLIPPPTMTYHRFNASWSPQGTVTRIMSRPAQKPWADLSAFERAQFHSPPHRHVVAFLMHQGFRLPSADEWEFACSAGSRTLFYWGNLDSLGADGAFSTYSARNAFGLTIANNPYHWEYCDTPGLMCGGDGGDSFCGAEGTLAEHLPLASAFYCELDEESINHGVSAWVRRVVDLGKLFE